MCACTYEKISFGRFLEDYSGHFSRLVCLGFSKKKVRFCDPITRLILIRVQRNDCNKVRAAITLLTSIPKTTSTPTSLTGGSGSSSNRGSEDVVPIIATILSVHGCLRTAKLGTMKCIKHIYRSKVLQLQNDTSATTTPNRRVGKDDDFEDDDGDSAKSNRNNKMKKKKQKMTTTSASTTTTTNNDNNNNTKERRELLRQLDDALVSIQTME